MKPRYYTIEEMLFFVREPNKSACKKILADYGELFEKVPGATHNHQAWPGGYYDHVREIMNILILHYRTEEQVRPLPFSMGDALLVVFLHDIEKPWAYEFGPEGELRRKESLRTKAAQHAFRAEKIREYGIVLTPEQENGMKYVEGEMDDYSSAHRVMGELAALCHVADVISARLRYDYPKAENDPWTGARRIR